MNSFETIQMPEGLSKALKGMQITTPTPIQAQAIPVAKQGHDVIGIAQTGTGKTLAFCLPMIEKLLANPQSQGLVLVPTRELATQIFDVVKRLTFHTKNMQASVVIGGVSMYAQLRAMSRQTRIIIATPGRLFDHIERRTINLSKFDYVVLDEADRMLDIGFEPQLRKIFTFLPKKRQTVLFSATFPKSIERLTMQYMFEPKRITVGQISQPAAQIDQAVIKTTDHNKNDILMDELEQRQGSVLIFARTKHRTDRVCRMLNENGFRAERIHGDRSQGQRTKALDMFRKKRVDILVATDIASRGIDVPHIEHVVNYDLPQQAEDYVHRIGRTARAGAKGSALCLVTPQDNYMWKQIQKLNAPRRA